jgi:hypothetical protein
MVAGLGKTIDIHAKGRFESLHPERKGGLRGLTKNSYVLWTAVFASLGGFLCITTPHLLL